MEIPQPTKEHQWLQQIVGEWTFEAECPGGPGEAPSKHVGTETVRSVGGLWIVAEGRGEMPGGGDAIMLLTLGFNPQTQRFVGSWVGSMMAHQWVYDGQLDAAGKTLILDTEGPSMSDPTKIVSYQERLEIISPDHRTYSSGLRGEDGQWTPFMVTHYHRKR